MKITEILSQEKPVLSFEVFPPKKESAYETVEQAAVEIARLSPSFMSVTYGAGGGTSQYTADLAACLAKKYGVTSMAHLTCVSSTREHVMGVVERLRENGIENILALRGDVNPDIPPKTDFAHASDLVSYIRAHSDFGVSAACYPEGHLESPDLVSDIRHLKEKVDAGAQHLVSQLFFDNEDFFRFLERARIAGIDVPIEAGIMPVLSRSSIQRMVSMCGASLPSKLTRILARYGDHPAALREAGIAYAIDQISDLIAGGVEGIHLYTMNDPAVAQQIAGSLASIRSV